MSIWGLEQAKKYTDKNTKIVASNDVINGNFENGVSGWSLRAGEGELSAINNTLSYKCNASTTISSEFLTNTHTGKVITGNKYYLAVKYYAKTKSTRLRAGLGGEYPYFPNVDSVLEWKRVSLTFEAISDYSRLGFFANVNVGDEIDFQNVAVIDLTRAFGKGNEPEAKEMDNILNMFHNGWFKGKVNLLNFQNVFNYYLKEIRDLKTAITAMGGSV